MKKRILSVFLLLCMVFTMLPTFAVATENPFTDVKPGDWFADEVQYVYENGLMSGTSSETFSPFDTTTRGMVVTILYRLENCPEIDDSCPFTDVNSGSYYEIPITWASKNGIVSGYSETSFGPNNFITREQLAAILYRYADFKGYDVSNTADLSKYEDENKISGYAKTALAWANAAGLINGTTNTTLDPQGNAIRAQVAAILMRFCENVAPQTYTVTFDYNYEDKGTYKTVAVKSGNTVECPEAPTRDGYMFKCWCRKKWGGTAFDFNSEITKNITLYARWVEVSDDFDEYQSEAKEYFEENSTIVNIIEVEQSEDIINEADVKALLENRNLAKYEITYDYTINGEYTGECEISEESSEYHPMYQTIYAAKSSDEWVIYVINGKCYASPVTFNLKSDLGVQLLLSESEVLTSYDDETNVFFETIPYKSAVIVLTVEKIDAETLDNLTVEEICKISGATFIQDAEEEDESEESSISTFSLTATSAESYGESTPLSAQSSQDDDPLIVVSLGDSYSSGEGNEPFYGQTTKSLLCVNSYDWLAHRSEISWPALLKFPNIEGTLHDYKVELNTTSTAKVQWYFAAASGATTDNFRKVQTKTYNKLAYSTTNKKIGWLSNTVPLPSQLSVFNGLKGKVDYVTLTIGGNDLKFSEIITQCAKESSYLHHLRYWNGKTHLQQLLDDTWETVDLTMNKIEQVYNDIVNAAGEQATIIVAGYPKLLNKYGLGIYFSIEEAKDINNKVHSFNVKIKECVEKLQANGINIYFADVEEKFEGHEPYTFNPWINGIYIVPKAQDIDEKKFSSYSMHPNAKGQQAYADCVNAVIEQIEGEKAKGKKITGVITIADEDTDLTNNLPLSGATVKINYNNVSVTTNGNGEYSLSDIPVGEYKITVSKDGYITVTDTVVIEKDDTEVLYNVTIEAISNEYNGVGYASGMIYDVGTGLGVSDMTLYIRAGIGNTSGDIIKTIEMGSSSSYEISDGLSGGNYTVQIVDRRTGISDEERYITSNFNIKILGGKTIGNQNGYISNSITAEGLRIILTWGSAPEDLDSHLVGPNSESGTFHVYYIDKVYDTIVDLDVDDVDGNGPETITVHSTDDGIYTYAVHDFTNRESSSSSALSSSGAVVKVLKGSQLIGTYNVPAGYDGTVWTVFTYNSVTDVITPINTMSYQSDPALVAS